MNVEQLLFDAPIPGQSLTNSPDNPLPFERPPQYTDYNKAQEVVFEQLMENAEEVIDLLDMGIPASLLATQTVMAGFASGKWNPDMMLLLIEPALYTVLFIAEQASVDYILDFDDEFETLEPETRMKADSYIQKSLKQIVKDVESKTESADIKDIMPQSLLGKVSEE